MYFTILMTRFTKNPYTSETTSHRDWTFLIRTIIYHDMSNVLDYFKRVQCDIISIYLTHHVIYYTSYFIYSLDPIYIELYRPNDPRTRRVVT